jgi:hypothetical protein
VGRQSRDISTNQPQTNSLPYVTAHGSSLTAHASAAFCPLPAACRIFSNSTNAVAYSDSGAFAISFTDAAAESASMGSSDLVSWIAV